MIRLALVFAMILASFVPVAATDYNWQIVGAASAVEAITKSNCLPHSSAYLVAPTDSNARLNIFTFAPTGVQSISAVRVFLCVAAISTPGEYGGSRYLLVVDPTIGYVFAVAQVDSGSNAFRETAVTLSLDPRTSEPWTVNGVGTLLSQGLVLFGSLTPTGMESGIAVSRFTVEIIP